MNNDSHPHMIEADSLLSAGQLQQAQNLYLAVIQQNPDQAEAYFKLAWIADKEGKSLSAKKYLQKAYDKNPNNKEYLIALGTLLSKSGRHNEAAKLYEHYLNTNNKQDDVFFHYANLQIATGQYNDAIAALKSSINLNPGKLPYYMKLGEVLFHLGQFSEALAVYKSAFDKGLQSEGLFLNLAKLNTDFGQLQAAKEVLSRGMIFYPRTLSFPYRLQSIDPKALKESFYSSLKNKESQLDPKDRFYAYWLLAQHENARGAYSEEMHYLIKAHEAFKQTATFNISSDQFTALIQQLNDTSRKLDQTQFSPISETASPIFIVGIPRCGSTLLENIICAGPNNIHKGEETGVIFHYASNTLKTLNTNNWKTFKQQCDQHYRHLGLVDSEAAFTDKSLENIFMIDLLLALYPKAKIVYCQRNPLACIVSILRNNLSVLPWAHDLESIFKYVDLCLSAIHSAQEKYGEQILTLNYEDLVSQPENISKQLMEFCKLPWDESCLNKAQRSKTYSKTASHMQIRNEINTESIELYKRYNATFDAFVDQYS